MVLRSKLPELRQAQLWSFRSEIIRYFRKSWHIYGHIHNKKAETYEIMKTKEHALNAGCMINNYAPASFNELIRNNKIFQEERS